MKTKTFFSLLSPALPLLCALAVLLAPATAGADESGATLDWDKIETLRWDPALGDFVVGERPKPIDWSAAERVQWDAENRRFQVIKRSTAEMDAADAPSNRQFDERGYRLSVRDQIDIQVFEEPDLSLTQRIDGDGQIRIPLLGNRRIAGKTVREAEDFIENLYQEEGMLRDPMITVRVNQYAPKEVSILGAVGRPGKQEFPIERNRLDIVDVVSRAGGFSGIARGNAVHITRRDERTGEEETFTVNVESMITGSRRGDGERFYVYPGDVIWVPERVF